MKGRIGPYKISERLGTGGMGEVFKAYDDRLERWVAIKRIRPGKEDTDENRQRFLREARATAALNHSSIVHVYDIFRDEDSDCIVMEYVDGRTLQSMTTDGPLDPLRTARLAQEIAEGLAAAHEKNILHRDLKTENIIVTPEGHAKILDFGLARPLISNELDSSLTGKGQLVGTSRSMSPEYVGGDKVDERSDLFAFGVLLYEALTGHSPFKAQNTLATLKQIIVHQQPPAREINPAVPQELSDLIDRLLEKAPEERPQSAKEVAADLAWIGGHLSSGSIAASAGSSSQGLSAPDGEWRLSTTMSHPRLRRYWVGLAAIVVLALVGAYFLGSRDRLGPASPVERVRVVLGDFQNRTNDPLLDDSLDVAFRTGLEQSRFIEVLPEGQMQATLERMKREPASPIDVQLGAEISQREGAQWLVMGSIVKVGPNYSLSAEIIDPQNQRRIFTAGDAAATQGDILRVLQRIVRELRTELGESAAAIEKDSVPLAKVTTHDLEALKMYSLGWNAAAQGNSQEGILFLTRALERDPQFAMAHAKLGTVYRALQQNEKAIRHFDEALKYADRLTGSEELYLEGWMANLRGTPEDMVRAWRLMTTLYPDNLIGYQNLGLVYWLYLNEFTEAERVLRMASALTEPQRQLNISIPLGQCEVALGHYDEAFSIFKTHDIADGMADVYLLQGNFTAAWEKINDIEDPLPTLMAKADYHILQGQLSDAIPLARSAIDLAEQQGRMISMLSARMVLITALQQSSSNDELAVAIEETIQLSEPLLSNEFSEPGGTPLPFLATLGKISARSSFLEQSKRIHQLIQGKAESSRIGLWISYLRMLEGEILAAQGRNAAAIAKFREAIGAVDTFQARESLAFAYELNGEIAKAIEENLWVERRQGRAFSECYNVCAIRPRSIADWNVTLLRLGRLYEALGRPGQAETYYQRLMERWVDGDHSAMRQDAARRLEALGT
ncbi:MAG TPA: protein kinase [Thermoanaerobaculia bacterium]|jgi:putative peptide modification system cyclase